ncbi:MAG: Yip1 family protein [Betaproteobacteria bacterium]|nr:Yip1 family protein [Betaproteobacteria bacterium]
MSILHIPKLFTSSHEGWDAFSETRPSPLRLFVVLALPCSLIPPLMLEYAGHHVGAAMFPDTPGMAWSMAAFFFLLAEWLTVPFMGWAIASIARSKGIATDQHDAFALAAVAPIPLWLSSLVLFHDQILLIMAGLVVGLAASVILIFRGVQNILKVREELVAIDVAYTVTALGLVAWVTLVMLGLLPVLA